MEPEEHFLAAMQRIGERYDEVTFFQERDLVYVLQLDLVEALTNDLGLRVFHGYGMKRGVSADLVVENVDHPALPLAIEFKTSPITGEGTSCRRSSR